MRLQTQDEEEGEKGAADTGGGGGGEGGCRCGGGVGDIRHAGRGERRLRQRLPWVEQDVAAHRGRRHLIYDNAYTATMDI